MLKGRRLVCGVKLFVVGLRLPDGEDLIVVTDKEPETATEIRLYGMDEMVEGRRSPVVYISSALKRVNGSNRWGFPGHDESL